MNKFARITLMILLVGIAGASFANEAIEKNETMSAKGSFEANLTPQQDDAAPAGRMIINKSFQGELEGTGVGQMISKRIVDGAAVYFAIEEFSGSLLGKNGGFTLIHKGHMDAESQSLQIDILEGSGSGELVNISGSMLIVQDANGHTYELKYTQ